jgi:uncharacterized membrane protein YoaK (UPF0700 family)
MAGASRGAVNPERQLIGALLALTFVTGIVDAVSYLGLGHVFTANMTGNIALLGFALAGATGLSIARSSLSLLAFLLGAVLGGQLRLVMTYATRRRWLFAAGSLEAALLIAAASNTIGVDADAEHASWRVYVVIALTAAAMGLRTATVRQLAVLDVSTTVLTQTLAALASESTLAGGSNPRWGRRVGGVVLMLVGAAVGVLLLRFGLTVSLLVCGACALGASIYAGIASGHDMGDARRAPQAPPGPAATPSGR